MSDGFDMEQYELELDKTVANAFPSDDPIHGTITIRDSDLSDDLQEKALAAFVRAREMDDLAHKPSEALAHMVIERVEEKLG